MDIQRYQINNQSPLGYTANPVGPWVAASEALARIAELEAENARLREALTSVLRDGRGRTGGSVYMVRKEVWLAAKAALAACPTPPPGVQA